MELDWSRETYLPRLFEAFSINCVLDVGARIGDYGLLLRRAGYSGRIMSFEPVAESFGTLHRRCEHDPQWTAYPYALGSSDGTATINVMRETVFSSMLEPSALGEFGNVVERQETVEVRRLDSVFSEVTRGLGNPCAYLKMDTQGWDSKSFAAPEGASNTSWHSSRN